MTDTRPIETAAGTRAAVRLVTAQGSGVAEAARHLGRQAGRLGRWRRAGEPPMNGAGAGKGGAPWTGRTSRGCGTSTGAWGGRMIVAQAPWASGPARRGARCLHPAAPGDLAAGGVVGGAGRDCTHSRGVGDAPPHRCVVGAGSVAHGAPYGGASAPDRPTASERAAIAVQGGHPDQRGKPLPAQRAQLRQIEPQRPYRPGQCQGRCGAAPHAPATPDSSATLCRGRRPALAAGCRAR
jgi:hypothetical protein